MRTINVVAGIIHRKGEYLATQRGYGEFEGMWEFPGGKMENGESPQDALKREIQEELGVDIEVEEYLCTTEYDYPTFHLTLQCYLCKPPTQEIELREHKSARWLTAETLNEVEWLPADKEIIERLKTL